MGITLRALITLVHGMLFGAFFLMAIYGLVVELYRSAYVEPPSKLTVLYCLSVVSRHSPCRRYKPDPLSAVSFEIERHDGGMAQPGDGVERTHCLDSSHSHDHGGLCVD